MIVCLCKSVTDQQIADSVENGVTSFEAMQAHNAVSTVCGTCSCEVKKIMQNKLNVELSRQANTSNFQPHRVNA